MKTRSKTKLPERLPQQTPQAVLDALLGLVRRKFYEGDDANFFKDKWQLLQWALLWPARHWFKDNDVSLPPARYQEIVGKIIMDAVVHQGDKIHYRPGWLKAVIERHFEKHGHEYRDEAKVIEMRAETVMLALGKLPTRAPDVVNDFTAASKLLDGTKPVRNRKAAPVVGQLNLDV